MPLVKQNARDRRSGALYYRGNWIPFIRRDSVYIYIYIYVARVSDEPPNRGYLNKCRKLPHSRLVATNKYVRNCIKKRSQWIYVFVLDFTPVRHTICINSLLDVFLFSRNSRVAGVAWFAG